MVDRFADGEEPYDPNEDVPVPTLVQNYEPDAPYLLARLDDDEDGETDERSTTHHVATFEQEYVAGACGTARVTVFVSDDFEDRGGVVLRLRIRDDASSIRPATVMLNGGAVELHLGGDAEAHAMVDVLEYALRHLKQTIY